MRAWSSPLVIVLLACVACSSSGNSSSSTTTTEPTTVAKPFSLTSTAFANNGAIPPEYTCTGAGKMPPLAYDGVPPGVTNVALIVHDPDAPVPGGFTHYALANLPPVATTLPPVPSQANEIVGWRPPCPPAGSKPHHYRFTLYALRPPAATIDEIQQGAIAQVTLVGTYSR